MRTEPAARVSVDAIAEIRRLLLLLLDRDDLAAGDRASAAALTGQLGVADLSLRVHGELPPRVVPLTGDAVADVVGEAVNRLGVAFLDIAEQLGGEAAIAVARMALGAACEAVRDAPGPDDVDAAGS